MEKQNRVRVPLEIIAVVHWLNAKQGEIECVGMLGPAGGVQLEPLAIHENNVRQFTQALGNAPPNASESAEAWVEVARFLSTAWRIPISIEATRISITLPEPPRRALQLPKSGATVVVFGFGEILEIWDAAKWHDHVRVVAKGKASAIPEAVEDLGHR